MADTSSNTMDAIRKGVLTGEYIEIPNVPVFDEHDEFDTRRYIRDPKSGNVVPNPNHGQLVRRFDRARLEAIAQKCNQRAQMSGDLAPIGPGHTIPDPTVPETQQPPIWGYAGGYRVGVFGPSGKKLGILATLYARKEHADAVKKEFPRRSIELVQGEEFIDWIALLRRSPQRDIGLLAFSRDAQALARQKFCPWEVSDFRPAADRAGQRMLSACVGRDGRLRYSADHSEDNMAEPNIAPDAALPPSGALPGAPPAPDMDELNEDEKKTAERYWRHYQRSYPAIKHVCDRYAAEMGGGMGGGMPSATNAIPGGGPPIGMPPMPEDDKMRMQRNQQALSNYSLEQQNLMLQQQVQAERYAREKANCERDLTVLAGLGYQFDLASEVAAMVPLDVNGRAAHVEKIKRFNRQAPVGTFLVPAGGAYPDPGQEQYGPGGEPRYRKIQAYSRAHPGVEWSDCARAVDAGAA